MHLTPVKCSHEDHHVPLPETRDRLLDAAASLAREQGLAQLTLASVAQRAGVSRQAVYLHFGNRATLLVAMTQRMDVESGFVERLRACRGLPPVDALRQALELWLDYLPTILPIARAVEAAAVTGDDGAQAYADRMAAWWRVLRSAVARVAQAGRLAPGWEVEQAADWVWAQVHPSRYHHLVVERGWSPQEFRRRTLGGLDAELLAAPREAGAAAATA